MTTRRGFLLAGLISFSAAALAAVGPAKSGPLEVTYYYLPG
jgi:hypothetical protein